MASNTTVVKFGGLLVALGFFGMGPGTLLIDEIRAKYQKAQKRKRLDEDHGNGCDEQHHDSDNHQHLQTENATNKQIYYPLSPYHQHTESADLHDFIYHPFQLAGAVGTHPIGPSGESNNEPQKEGRPNPNKKDAIATHQLPPYSVPSLPPYSVPSSNLFYVPPRYSNNITTNWTAGPLFRPPKSTE